MSAIVTDGITITDSTEKAESFNNLFTSIETDLHKNITPTKKRFTNFLKRLNPENFIITYAIPDKIGDLINSFEPSKSVGRNSISTKIMKIANGIIYSTLSKLVNNSIPQEIFPNICKQAKVIPQSTPQSFGLPYIGEL